MSGCTSITSVPMDSGQSPRLWTSVAEEVKTTPNLAERWTIQDITSFLQACRECVERAYYSPLSIDFSITTIGSMCVLGMLPFLSTDSSITIIGSVCVLAM